VESPALLFGGVYDSQTQPGRRLRQL